RSNPSRVSTRSRATTTYSGPATTPQANSVGVATVALVRVGMATTSHPSPELDRIVLTTKLYCLVSCRQGGDLMEEGGSARKRRAIVEAATAVFRGNGYLGASMDEIAALAAVSKQTVYQHFDDQEGLVHETT